MTAEPRIVVPKWLNRAEKREFRRVIAARKSEGRPLTPLEFNTALDYARGRERLATLIILAERLRRDSTSASYLNAIRAVEAATAASRRLARDLGLVQDRRTRPAKAEPETPV
jgi:phage terminase small subunit